MAIAARQIRAVFIVEPCFVAAPEALNRFVPKGHTLLLVQRTRDETVDLALDRPLLHYLRGPIHRQAGRCDDDEQDERDHDRKHGDDRRRSSRACDRRQAAGRSEEHTSELQSLMRISYAVFCLKKKKEQLTIATQHTTQLNYNNT